MNHSFKDGERQFNEYLRDGITAAKTGQNKLAQSLLNRALLLNNADSRPYLWLSATTDDPREQLDYLERAVSLDPTNNAARRGLAVLKGMIDPEKLIPEGGQAVVQPVAGEVQAEGDSYLCPRCGGRMAFSVLSEQLTCEYCGYYEEQDADEAQAEQLHSLADESERVLDFVMPTTTGHLWALAQHQLVCGRCGAHSLLPPGQKTNQCPYCGSNQILKSTAQEDLVEPQLLAVMKVDEQKAKLLAHRWLGKGFFSPDNLLSSSVSLRLRPGYYSFWTFDGTVEISWTCEVAEGSGNYRQWHVVNGAETRFFNDVLVSGVKALRMEDVNGLAPFDLENVEAFNPDFLAGWPAVLYDRSLSDSSLVGRDQVLNEIEPQLYGLIEVGREKRNVRIGGSQWSGLTFKHILLPLWTGEYQFQGKTYRVLINGQTGKVTGEKPRDSVKIVFFLMMIALFFVLLLLLYWIFGAPGPA